MRNYAFFLPQYHPTPENDKFWGKNFTEWTNVKGAKPLYPGHKQPLSPIDNDYYNLLDEGVLSLQFDKARKAGLDGFIYWHYYFGENRMTLEKVVRSHKASRDDFEFSFAWANASWTMSWKGDDKKKIFDQQYRLEDVDDHCSYLAEFLRDSRYTKINKKAVIYLLNNHGARMVDYLQKMIRVLRSNYSIEVILGLADHIGSLDLDCETFTFHYPPGSVIGKSFLWRIQRIIQLKVWGRRPLIFTGRRYLGRLKKSYGGVQDVVPTILTGWDNTPRYGKLGYVITGNRNELVQRQIDFWKSKECHSLQLRLWKSWNEWAEGNVMEGLKVEDHIEKALNVRSFE